MRIIQIVLLFLVCAISSVVSADILFRDVSIIDPNDGSSKTVDVLVSENRISQIADEITLDKELAASTQVINAAGKRMTAGLFNANTHIGLVEVGAVKETVDYSTKKSSITASLQVSDAINPSSVLIPYNRMLGLTHVLVLPRAKSGLFAGTAAIIQLTEENTVVKPAAAMVVALGNKGKKIAGGSRAAAIGLLREAFEDVNHFRSRGAQFYALNRDEYSLSRQDLEALVPVVKGELPLLVQVDRAVDIKRVVALSEDYKLKLIIAGAIEGWRVASLLAEHNIPVIIDPIRNLPTSYDTLGARLDNAKILHDAGVTLMFTGMGGQDTHNAYLVRQSAGNAVSNGLDMATAYKAMTVNPAKVFGLDDIGQFEEGAKANIVLWSGDPMEPSTVVEKVYINGQDYPLISRATLLRDRYLSKLRAVP